MRRARKDGVRSSTAQVRMHAALEAVLRDHPPASWTERDPIRFPRRRFLAGAERQDIEAVALFSAMMAYGRVDLFMAIIERVLEGCPPPYPPGFLRPRRGFRWPGYRFSRGRDLQRFLRAVARTVDAHGGLWEAFEPGWREGGSVWAGLAGLRTALVKAAGPACSPGLAYLLPDPGSGGCAKRWMLFLRWMARPEDGVDLGQWPGLSPAALIMPLDRHISRIARRLGWTARRSDDRRTAEEITAALRALDPADPLRYDFALCHLGMDGTCAHGRDPLHCARCGLVGLAH